MKKAIFNSQIFNSIILGCMMLIFSTAGFSQDPGGGPDGPPPAVPFDDYLLPIVVVVGLVVTFFAFKKLMSQKHA